MLHTCRLGLKETPETGSCAAHLAIEPVEWHSGVRQANHAYPSSSDIRQHCLVPGFPLLLLTPKLPFLVLGASALEAQRKSSPQEVLCSRVQCPCSITSKRLDGTC